MPAPQPRGTKACEHCQEPFSRVGTTSVVTFNRTRFCSPKCRNQARTKPRALSLVQFAILSVLVELEREGKALTGVNIATRYAKLKGHTLPLRPDGYPNISGASNTLRILEQRGFTKHVRGQGTREGAHRLTPAGRLEVDRRRSLSGLPQNVSDRKVVTP